MEIIKEIGKKGQVVIPKDIRESLGLREKDKIVFEISNNEVKIKSKENPEEFIKKFFSLSKIKRKKSLTPEEIDKIMDESYDLP